MKNIFFLWIVLGMLGTLVWPGSSYADEHWGQHGTHQYYRYHDHPHYGVRAANFYPDEYYPVSVGGASYYYDDGIYYDYAGGTYVVVSPPMGAVVGTIPADFQPIFINGVTYYTDNGVYYVRTPSGYRVVRRPV